MTDPTPSRDEALENMKDTALLASEYLMPEGHKHMGALIKNIEALQALIKNIEALQAQIVADSDDLTTVYMVGVHAERQRIEKAVEGLRKEIPHPREYEGVYQNCRNENDRARGWNDALDAVIQAIKTNSSAGER